MAHFRGVVQGSRGEASRNGGKASGLQTTAASWQGAVGVYLYERDGVDCARVCLKPWHGHGVSRALYDGPVAPDKVELSGAPGDPDLIGSKG